MKRMTQVLFVGLLLSISTIALADKGHDRYGHHGRHDNRGPHAYRYDRHPGHRTGHGYYVNNHRPAPRHLHHGRYCYDWHPRRVYAYRDPGLVIVIDPRTGLHISGGR
jgi:hypothetical protein